MTNGLPMNPSDIKTAVDHASIQSDRWLMIAAAVVMLIAVGWLVRHLTKLQAASEENTKRMMGIWREDVHAMNTEIKTLHNERVSIAERYASEVRQLGAAQMEEAKSLLRCYAEALSTTSKTMGQVEAALRDLQHHCALSRGNIFPLTQAQKHQPFQRENPNA